MPPEIKTKTEAEVIAALAQAGNQPLEIKSDRFPATVFFNPYSKQFDCLERFMERPIRKRAKINLRDHQSFIDYVVRHAEKGTQLFCTLTEAGGSFTAIIDYHQAEETGEPRRGEHVCVYTAEHTPEWKRWMENSGKSLTQTELALFIEDNRIDIIEPDGATMLELIKSFEASAGSDFKSVMRLDNGDRVVNYKHTTTARAGTDGQLTIPETFKIRLPIFSYGPPYDLDVRFRYRVREGILSVGYEIVRPHKIIELALSESRQAIEQTLGRTVLNGTGNVTGS